MLSRRARRRCVGCLGDNSEEEGHEGLSGLTDHVMLHYQHVLNAWRNVVTLCFVDLLNFSFRLYPSSKYSGVLANISTGCSAAAPRRLCT